MAAITGGIIAGAGALAGGAMQAGAAKDAASQQAQAMREANALQERMYNQNRADMEPWRNAGAQSLTQLANPDFQRDFSMNDFVQDPGYQFRMQEGQKALERSAAARGNLMSGGFAKALSQYGQNQASNEYGNAYNRFNADRDRRFNRLSNIAGLGQTSASQGAQLGSQYAGQIGQNLMNNANAQGAAGIAGANAWGGALSNIGRIGMDTMALSQFGGGGGGAGNWMKQSQNALGSNGSSLTGMNYNQSANDFWGLG